MVIVNNLQFKIEQPVPTHVARQKTKKLFPLSHRCNSPRHGNSQAHKLISIEHINTIYNRNSGISATDYKVQHRHIGRNTKGQQTHLCRFFRALSEKCPHRILEPLHIHFLGCLGIVDLNLVDLKKQAKLYIKSTGSQLIKLHQSTQ